MPIYQPTKKNASVKRNEIQFQILTLSEQIAETEGWDAVTMRRIAQEIDKSLPIVYRHFTAKEEIIDIVAQRGYIKIYVEFEKIIKLSKENKENKLKETINNLLSFYANFGLDNPALYQAMYGMNGVIAFQDAQIEESKKIYQMLLGELKKEISKPDDEVKLILDYIWSAIHGYVTVANLDRMNYSKEYCTKMVNLMTESMCQLVFNI